MQYKEKILFVIPPYLPFDEYIPKKVGQKLPSLVPPYGVLSLISYINKDKKYDIEIIDMNKTILENIEYEKNNLEQLVVAELVRKLLLTEFDYVCISALFNTCFPHLKYICETITHQSPMSVILLGGGLGTNLYEDLFKEFPEIDAICYGEGELPFYKLLNNIEHDLFNLHRVSQAWITKISLERNIIPVYDFIEDLDEIPMIDFSYIDLKKYNGRSYIDKDSNNIEMSIHTSRGCPYNCCYCSNGKVHGKKVRLMSTKRVIKTIKHYKKHYKMNTLFIEDDHFLADEKRVLYILNQIRKLKINVEFPNGVAVFKITEKIAHAFHKAKVKLLPLAIESGSTHVLKNIIHKPLKIEKVYEVVKMLRKYDIRLHAFIIIGFPDEFDEHREETLRVLLELKLDWVYVFIVVPIAGSKLYKDCEEKGYLLTKDYNQYTISNCNIKAPGVDPKKIEEYAQLMTQIVNFVDNTNYNKAKYSLCLDYFNNVVNHYPNQAIAHYMLYKVYSKIGCLQLSSFHYAYYKEIIGEDLFYRTMVFKLKERGYVFD